MTLLSISKGFEYYKKYGFNFTLKIFPLIFLFGFFSSLAASSSLSEGISNIDITILLINNFLISPLLTIISIFRLNKPLLEKIKNKLYAMCPYGIVFLVHNNFNNNNFVIYFN